MVFTMKGCCSPQHQPKQSYFKSFFKCSQAEESDSTVSSDEVLLTEGPAPVLEQMVRALR